MDDRDAIDGRGLRIKIELKKFARRDAGVDNAAGRAIARYSYDCSGNGFVLVQDFQVVKRAPVFGAWKLNMPERVSNQQHPDSNIALCVEPNAPLEQSTSSAIFLVPCGGAACRGDHGCCLEKEFCGKR